MKLSDLAPGDYFVHDDNDDFQRFEVLAHDVELENRLLPEGILEDLGARKGLGNGYSEVRPSMPVRWGQKGMLAAGVDWSTGSYTGGLALFPTGHNLITHEQHLRNWTSVAHRSFRHLAKHGHERLQASKAEVKYLVVANPRPTNERLMNISRMPWGTPDLLVEGHVYPMPDDTCDLDDAIQLGDPEVTYRRVLVRDEDDRVYAVDPRFLVYDPLDTEWEHVKQDRLRDATRVDRDRLRSALRDIANQHDTADSRQVSVTNTSVTMPIEVLESILLGGEEWATAELLDGIMILKDVLEEAS